MLFSHVTSALETIEKTTSRNEITEQLAQLFSSATPDEVRCLSYLTLGVLNPPYENTFFGIAQKQMAKIIMDSASYDELSLQEAMKVSGDLGSVIAELVWEYTDTLSVVEVYEKLSLLEKINGTGSQERKSDFLKEFLKNMSPLSAKYVVRIILGTLRLGFSDMTLLDAFSWMVTGDKSLKVHLEHAYNVCADIGLLGYTLKKEGIDAVKNFAIQVGIPIRPAAADRLGNAHEVFEKLGNCVAQPKLDGFRLQIHVDNRGQEPKIHFFSRNLLDMSDMFPELVAACKKIAATTFIVEGEAMVFDEYTDAFLPFQETVKRKRKHNIDEVALELPLKLYLFDLLYYNGESFLNKSHTERRKQLLLLLHGADQNAVLPIEERTIESADQLQGYFLESLALGLEGLVIKKPGAQYQPGKRNANWIKLKYQTTDTLKDTIDVVIFGYYQGKGKRAQFGIGAFLVGIYNAAEECFETIAKVGTGLTDKEWVALKTMCDEFAVKEQPLFVRCDKQLAPDVWVTPSIVCEVLADMITVSPVHTAGKTKGSLGYALRFPRFIKLRQDKDVYQSTSIDELKKIIAV